MLVLEKLFHHLEGWRLVIARNSRPIALCARSASRSGCGNGSE